MLIDVFNRLFLLSFKNLVLVYYSSLPSLILRDVEITAPAPDSIITTKRITILAVSPVAGDAALVFILLTEIETLAGVSSDKSSFFSQRALNVCGPVT